MLDNTIAKPNKDKQCYTKHIEEHQTIPWPKPTRTNNVIQNTSKNVRQYHGQNQQGQTMLYETHLRTSDNTMAKTNEHQQCNTKHIEERQTIPWPNPTRTNNVIKTHRRTSDNTMAKTNKDKQCNTKQFEERQTIPWPKPTRTSNVIQNTSKNVRQYHRQTQQTQTMLYKTHGRTSDYTMAKTNTNKQCYTKQIEERQTIPWPKPTRTKNVIRYTSKNVRQYHGQNQEGQTMLCKTHRRTSDNTMVKTNKEKQCNTKHIEERQKIPWQKPTRTSNVLQNTSKNVRQYHGQTQQGQTMQYKTHRRTSGNTMAKTNKDKRCYTKHIEERQTIPWPKPTRTNNVIQNTSKNVRQYHGQNQQGQTMLYKTHRRTSDITWPKPTRINNGIQNTSKNVRQ